MIIVSNTSPIINLAAIGQLELLRRIYGKVIVPQAVYDEVVVAGAGQPGAKELQESNWFEVKTVQNKHLSKALKLELHDGEAEAIAIAVELEADLVLLDERRARAVASRFALNYIGLLGIIVYAKHKGIIDKAKPVVDDLITMAGFWIERRLYLKIMEKLEE